VALVSCSAPLHRGRAMDGGIHLSAHAGSSALARACQERQACDPTNRSGVRQLGSWESRGDVQSLRFPWPIPTPTAAIPERANSTSHIFAAEASGSDLRTAATLVPRVLSDSIHPSHRR